MPVPVLTASVRYTDRATTRVYWVPSIAAATLVPTRAEMNAGTDLTGEINALAGPSSTGSSTAPWTITAERIDTQAITSVFKTEIAGSLSVPDPALMFYASKNGVDVRNLLAAGTSGNVMFCDGGDIGSNKAAVFPVSVATASVVRAVDGKTAAYLVVYFVITAPPAQNVLIP